MKENRLEFYVNGDRSQRISFVVRQIINAGYTGRNQEEVRKHVEELKQMGVPAPDSVPTYYLKSSSLLTTDNFAEVVDEDSTGEAEYVLLIGNNNIYVAVGSDHTDRKLEISSIPKAKQLCPTSFRAQSGCSMTSRNTGMRLKSGHGSERTGRLCTRRLPWLRS